MANERAIGRLHDKVAIVTGASAGIGRAMSLAYASEGARVVVADLFESEPRVVDEIHALYSTDRATFVTVDVSDSDSVDALVHATVARWGRLDIMCNNAGIKQPLRKPIWEIDNETWTKPLSVNLNGAMYGTRAAVRQMLTQAADERNDRGWIINTASVVAQAAIPSACAYVASKHGIIGLTKAAALDCAPHGIHVNAICPGYIHSNITAQAFSNEQVLASTNALHPLKGVGNPEDIAGAAVFLASADARWITGHALIVDGGYLAR